MMLEANDDDRAKALVAALQRIAGKLSFELPPGMPGLTWFREAMRRAIKSRALEARDYAILSFVAGTLRETP